MSPASGCHLPNGGTLPALALIVRAFQRVLRAIGPRDRECQKDKRPAIAGKPLFLLVGPE